MWPLGDARCRLPWAGLPTMHTASVAIDRCWVLARACVDGEVIDALLRLLQQRLPEEVPGDALHAAARLLQALVYGDRAHLRHKGQTINNEAPCWCIPQTAEI